MLHGGAAFLLLSILTMPCLLKELIYILRIEFLILNVNLKDQQGLPALFVVLWLGTE